MSDADEKPHRIVRAALNRAGRPYSPLIVSRVSGSVWTAFAAWSIVSHEGHEAKPGERMLNKVRRKTARREQKRQQFLQRRREFITDNPTPYERFEDDGGGFVRRVTEATAGAQLPTYRKGKHDRARRLTADDLAVGMFAVSRVGEKGLSYAQMDFCFRIVKGVGCHNAKCRAILSALVSRGLIKKIGNYSTAGAGFKGRGNQYRVEPEQFNEADFS
jgi:hypothetical protein